MLDNSRYPDNAEEIAAILTEEQLALLDQFPNLRRLDLSGSTCYDAILAWAQAHPQVEVNYSVTLPGGHTADRNTESLDLSKLSAEEVRSVLMLRRHLPKLQSVDLGSEREGLTLADGRLVCELGDYVDYVDAFGHKQMSGCGKVLANKIARETGVKTRSIEFSLMQRCSSHICSKTDIDEAEQIGAEAVTAAMRGATGVTMVCKRVSDKPYLVNIETADTSLMANKEKFFPRKWINSAGNGVSDEAIKYFLPLIQGEVDVFMKNGMPRHFKYSNVPV
jgi:hypothetical protein